MMQFAGHLGIIGPAEAYCAGKVGTLIADPSRVEKEWDWRTTRDLRGDVRGHLAFPKPSAARLQGIAITELVCCMVKE